MDSGDERDRGVWASERVYRALTRAYPEEVRRRFAEEMVRYFGDLCRKEWRSRGSKGLASMWVRVLPDLVFTVRKERGAKFLRNANLPVAPGTAARWGALLALLGGSLGVALTLVYFQALPILVPLDWWWGENFTGLELELAMLLSVLGMFGQYGTLVVRSGRPDALTLSGATIAALSAVCIPALYAYLTAGSLGWLRPPDEDFSWWEMHWYKLLQEVGMGAYALGLLLLGVSALLRPASIGLLILLNRSGMVYHALIGALPFFGTVLLG